MSETPKKKTKQQEAQTAEYYKKILDTFDFDIQAWTVLAAISHNPSSLYRAVTLGIEIMNIRDAEKLRKHTSLLENKRRQENERKK